jgi:integrase
VASIRERKDRKGWQVDYSDNTGRRRRLAAKTEEQAIILLGEKLKETRERGPSAPVNDDMTVGEYAELWLRTLASDVATEILTPATEKNYRWALDKHILPAFKRRRLRDLQPGNISRFIEDKQTELSRNTARALRATLSTMLAAAVEHGGMLTKNVAKMITIKRPRGKKSQQIARERCLNDGEIAAIIGAARDTQERALLLMLARTGCRPGEAMASQWPDLNFTTRKILIERGFHNGHLGATKTGETRYVDASHQLCEALSALYVEREKQALANHWGELPEWIFVQPNGKPLTISYVRRIFDRACRKAHISGHVTYDLRHSFASLLLAKGKAITYVSKQLGHTNSTTTLTYYGHWIETGDDQRLVDVLDTPVAPAFGTVRENVAYLQRKSEDMQLSLG